MEKRWVIQDAPAQTAVKELQQALGIHPALCRILADRGITNYEEARAFFRPSLNETHSPWAMKNMDRAVDRLCSAIERKEGVMVYGDYDVDGTTAVTLVYDFLSRYHDFLECYIPDRYQEGYGVSVQGMDHAKAQGCGLVLVLDCGIKAHEEIAYAHKVGLDVIVCDHHRPGGSLPPAIAVLDPKRGDCAYPYKELSGCGVGFKLIQALCEKLGGGVEETHTYLDLLAISIGADIVPVTGENRVLTQAGIQRINRDPRTGIRALLETAQLQKKEIGLRDVMFVLGPRINAAGRIDSGRKAVSLLLSGDSKEAREVGGLIHQTNEYRKDLDRTITRECLDRVASDPRYAQAHTTVLYDADWHKGVVGIVASRLMEHYYRPTIVMTRSNGVVAGSARSVKDFDIYRAIEACGDLVAQFGGHEYAAGLTLKEENVPAFQQRFEEVVRDSIDRELLTPEVRVDAEIPFAAITPKFYRVLKQFAPFGPGNPEPVFLTRNVVDTGSCRAVGKDRSHLRMRLSPADDPQVSFSAIGFGLAHKFDEVIGGDPFSVVYTVEENHWKGRVSLQLKVKDIKLGEAFHSSGACVNSGAVL